MAASRRSADRALLRDRPAAPLGSRRRSPARSPLTEASDLKVVRNWNKLDIDNPPETCGVYAVTNARQKIWYYIGKSQNIAKRIIVKNHPIQVTKNTALDLFYWYLRVEQKHVNWAEKYLIKEHGPEWNGHTSFGASWYTQWMCCDLLLTHDEWTRRAVLEAIGG